MKNPCCIVVILLFILTSCASIMKDKTELIMLSSKPEEAKIYVDGYPVGKTPVSLPVERTKHSLKFEKYGYNDNIAYIDRKLDWGWYIFGNIVFGGIPGWIVDAVTNHMWNLEPKKIHIVLEKK